MFCSESTDIFLDLIKRLFAGFSQDNQTLKIVTAAIVSTYNYGIASSAQLKLCTTCEMCTAKAMVVMQLRLNDPELCCLVGLWIT